MINIATAQTRFERKVRTMLNHYGPDGLGHTRVTMVPCTMRCNGVSLSKTLNGIVVQIVL